MACGRWLLAVQYFGVLYHSHKRYRRDHLLQPIVCLISGCMFLAGHLIPPSSHNAAASKLVLLFLPVAFEAVATTVISIRDVPAATKMPNESMMGERFGLVSLIVLGEGTIQLYEALAVVFGGLGFTTSSYFHLACALLSIFLLWYLIFADFDKERPIGRGRIQVRVLSCQVPVPNTGTSSSIFGCIGSFIWLWF